MSLKHLWAFLGHSHFSCLPLALIPVGFPVSIMCSCFPRRISPHLPQPWSLLTPKVLPAESFERTDFQAQISRVQPHHKDTLALSLVGTLYTHAAPRVIKAKRPIPGPLPLSSSISSPLRDLRHPTCQGNAASCEGRVARWIEGGRGNDPPVYLNFSIKIK